MCDTIDGQYYLSASSSKRRQRRHKQKGTKQDKKIR